MPGQDPLENLPPEIREKMEQARAERAAASGESVGEPGQVTGPTGASPADNDPPPVEGVASNPEAQHDDAEVEKVQCYCGAMLAADDDDDCPQCERPNSPDVRKPPGEWGRTSGGVN